MKLKWQQAPVKTQWGDEMVVASVAIDKDHTICLYCEREQTPKVEAMFSQRKPLTNEEITKAFNEAMAKRPKDASNAETNRLFVRAIEAAHGIEEKNNG